MKMVLIRNASGSVQHYYHFFFAALIPLLARAAVRAGGARGPETCLIRSCGPMDAHLRALERLGQYRFRILPPDAIRLLARWVPEARLIRLESQELYRGRVPRERAYQRDELDRARSVAFGLPVRAAPTSPRSEPGASSNEAVRPTRILVVEREPPDPFYASRQSEKRGKGAGASRRSIPNVAALMAGLREGYDDVLQASLERCPLESQIALFAAARVVVAQHGAALANLVWMRPGSSVVEIVPEETAPSGHFSRLADVLGLDHARVPQASSHAPVDVPTVLAAVRKAYDASG